MMATKPHQSQTILVVDDTPANLLLLSRMLTERGYRPIPVLSGELALKAACERRPDLILLDITMPEMNGYEVCERIKANPLLKDTPVIFISGLSETIDKVKAFQVGGVDYVTKPFQFEEVYARIGTHLELRRLEKLRDSLTHMIVHDLRNPLAAICGVLDLLDLREGNTFSASTQHLVTTARLSALELCAMVTSMLDVSKLEAGEMKLRLEPCLLGALIRDIVAAVQPLSDKRTVTLDVPSPDLTVTVDAGLLRRILQNLLSNAIRYTPVGCDVRIVVTPTPGAVRVAVVDAGPGIAPEFHQRIFEKFGQVEDRLNRLGTGLGLTFCRLAVEAHGGQMGVESEVGKGSTFWFTLPGRGAGTSHLREPAPSGQEHP